MGSTATKQATGLKAQKVHGTKVRIMEKAGLLFWQHSYEAVSVAEICDCAEVKKGSFYHFFSSKEALLMEILAQAWEHYRECLLNAAFEPDIPPVARFERYCDWIEAEIAGMLKETEGKLYGCQFGNMAMELATRHDAVRALVHDVFSYQHHVFKQAIVEAQARGEMMDSHDPEQLAHFLLAHKQGLAVLSVTMEPAPGMFTKSFMGLVESFR